MTRILVASDGSPAAEGAAATAVKLAGERNAEVVLLHVVDATPHVLDDPAMSEALQRVARTARDHGVVYEFCLASGFDLDVLLERADAIDADLIADGSNRRGTVGAAFRRVSRALLKRVRRSVHVVDSARADAERRWQAEISRGWQPSASARRPSR